MGRESPCWASRSDISRVRSVLTRRAFRGCNYLVDSRPSRLFQPNLVSHAGLIPAMGLAQRAGLIALADRYLTVPGGVGSRGGFEDIRAGGGHDRHRGHRQQLVAYAGLISINNETREIPRPLEADHVEEDRVLHAEARSAWNCAGFEELTGIGHAVLTEAIQVLPMGFERGHSRIKVIGDVNAV